MADIEAEAKKLVNSLNCFQAVCMTQASFDYENHDIAAVAEFCRKLVGDKDNEIAELNIHRDGFRQTIRELEQENRNHELTISSYQVVERELNDQLLQYSNILAAERADNADLSEGIAGMILDRDYFEGKLNAAEGEIAKLKDSNIRLSEARSRWR